MNCRGRYYIQMAEDHQSKGLGGGQQRDGGEKQMEAEDRGMKGSHPGHSSQARSSALLSPT